MSEQLAFQAFWSQEDEAFVAVVAEFPSLSVVASTAEVALEELRALVEEIRGDLGHEGAPTDTEVAWGLG